MKYCTKEVDFNSVQIIKCTEISTLPVLSVTDVALNWFTCRIQYVEPVASSLLV